MQQVLHILYLYIILMIIVLSHVYFLKDKKGTFQIQEYEGLSNSLNNLENLFNPRYLLPLVGLVFSQQKMFFKVKKMTKKIRKIKKEKIEVLTFLNNNKDLYVQNYDFLRQKLENDIQECDKTLLMVKNRLDF